MSDYQVIAGSLKQPQDDTENCFWKKLSLVSAGWVAFSTSAFISSFSHPFVPWRGGWEGDRVQQAGDPSPPAHFPPPVSRCLYPEPSCSPGQLCSRLFTDLGLLPGFPLLLCTSVFLHLLCVLFHVLFQQFTYLGLNFCFICFFISFLVNFFPLK